SHPTVSTPGGTTLDYYGTYIDLSPGGTTQQQMHMYGEGAEAHKDPLSPTLLGTVDTTPKLTPFSLNFKRAESPEIDLTLLNKWSGKRKGFRPDQNTAMSNTSANVAAVASFGDKAKGMEWQWLHLIAFTLGGDIGDPLNPNTKNNLVCGTAGANG